MGATAFSLACAGTSAVAFDGEHVGLAVAVGVTATLGRPCDESSAKMPVLSATSATAAAIAANGRPRPAGRWRRFGLGLAPVRAGNAGPSLRRIPFLSAWRAAGVVGWGSWP